MRPLRVRNRHDDQAHGSVVMTRPLVIMALILAVAGLVCTPSIAGPVLHLTDGRDLAGVDLHREGDLYLLEIAGGSMIPVPVSVVKEIRWVEVGRGDSGAWSGVANIVTSRTGEGGRDADAGNARKQPDQNSTEQGRGEDSRAEAARVERTLREAAALAGRRGDEQGRGVTLAGPEVRFPTPSEQLAVFGEPAQFAQDVVHFDLGGPSYWIMDPAQAMGSPSHFAPSSPNATWTPKDGFKK